MKGSCIVFKTTVNNSRSSLVPVARSLEDPVL